MKKYIFSMFALVLGIAMTSCQKNEPGIHTDASTKVVGVYTGIFQNAEGTTVAEDAVITIVHIDKEGTQADSVYFRCASISMDENGVFNVAAAGENRYVFSSSCNDKESATGNSRGCCGVLDNGKIDFQLSVNKKNKISTASTATRCHMICTKQ